MFNFVFINSFARIDQREHECNGVECKEVLMSVGCRRLDRCVRVTVVHFLLLLQVTEEL